ncbi:MAG TPA: DUF481 domain-containing protein [Burkholderiales bacterium]
MARWFFPHSILLATLLPNVPVHAQADWLSISGASPILSEAASVSKKQEGFFGALVLGYQGTTGNTDTSSLNAKLSFGYVAPPWRHALMLRAVRGSTDDVTTVQEREAALQSDYVFGDGHYVFGALNYTENRFSGYDWRTTGVVGYGRRLLNTDRHTLDVQAGAGTRRTRLSDGGRQHEEIVQLAGGYVWAFSEAGRFTQRVRVDYGSDNTFTELNTAVESSLPYDLALSISYTLQHNSNVPAGRVKTNTATLVSVIYGF